MLVNVISLLQRAGKNGVKVGVANGELQVSFSKGQTIDPDLLGQLKVADELQASIGQEVIKLQNTADETAKVRSNDFSIT